MSKEAYRANYEYFKEKADKAKEFYELYMELANDAFSRLVKATQEKKND